MDNWQTIETAPKDGTEFDAWGFIIPDSASLPVTPEFRRHVGCYWGERDSSYVARRRGPCMGREGWCTGGSDGWSWAAVLTHWMPVPRGPEVTNGTRGGAA